MAKTHSGGGRTPTEQRVRTGKPASGVNPGHAGSIGTKMLHEAHRTPMQDRSPYGATLGNAKALAVGKGGPGADRTIYRTGTQGTHGPVVQGPARPARDILSEFGPESRLRRSGGLESEP
jgi:hypothetical protein